MALTKVGMLSTSWVVLGIVTGVLLKLSFGIHLQLIRSGGQRPSTILWSALAWLTMNVWIKVVFCLRKSEVDALSVSLSLLYVKSREVCWGKDLTTIEIAALYLAQATLRIGIWCHTILILRFQLPSVTISFVPLGKWEATLIEAPRISIVTARNSAQTSDSDNP